MSENSNMSFERVRGMLTRAAEIRDSEQQQIFDSLDEIHARLATLDSLGAVRKRLAELPDRTEVSVLAERLDETVAKLDSQEGAIAATTRGIDAIVDRLDRNEIRLDGLHSRLEELANRPAVDPTEQLSTLADRLAALATRLDTVAARLDAVEEGLTGRMANLGGTIEQGLGKLDATLIDRPDRTAVAEVVEQANKDSERRSAGHLDEAMATFAEIILGRGAATMQPMLPPPRPAQRRGRSKPAIKAVNGRPTAADDADDPDLD